MPALGQKRTLTSNFLKSGRLPVAARASYISAPPSARMPVPLHWNSFETCWDCTCHGSQFSVDGEPLNAPAFKPLAEVIGSEDMEAKRA